ELNRESDILIAMYNPNLKNNQYSAPNKVYEAMKFGKPIIVARGTGVDQLVSKEKIGYISKYQTKDFIKVINNIFKYPDEFKEKSFNSKKVHPKYSWNKMRKILSDEYKNLTNE